MRVVVAIAAMVAAPVLALADEPTVPTGSSVPTAPAGGATPAPSAPAPASAPAPGTPAEPPTAAPGETPVQPEPKTDPAYGDKPEYDTRNAPGRRGKDVVVIAYPERSRSNVLLLGGLAAGGVLFGGIGVYFHLDSRSAADEVSANKNTGVPWTQERADTYDRAHSSAVAAGVLYGIGGALLLATAVTYIVTEPKAEKMVIHPHVDEKPTALVAPLPGGAMFGGAWRF